MRLSDGKGFFACVCGQCRSACAKMQKSGNQKRSRQALSHIARDTENLFVDDFLQQALGHIARDAANFFVNDLKRNVEQSENWKRLQKAIDELLSRYAETEIQRRMLYYTFPGGSKQGRKILRRDFEGAFNTLMLQYFVKDPVYPAELFRRRYRVSKAIFERVYTSCLKHPSFQHEANAAGKKGIHPLVKTTACFRHIAYGTGADEMDEKFQISESTFGETFPAFCDV